LPAEKKLEVKNKITSNETEVLEWQPPKSDEIIAFETVLKNLKQNETKRF